MSDKEVERRRYEERARAALESGDPERFRGGATAIPPVLRGPYLAYEDAARRNLGQRVRALEIGAGTGFHTRILVERGAEVVATDIAAGALSMLARAFGDLPRGRLMTTTCDMESLPFRDGAFDVVASAGSLSYGDPGSVDSEIVRVLRRGGNFICVDSLNHNPIYRLNRWLHLRRGHRSESTIRRIPDLPRIASFSRYFEAVEVRYFGGFTWVMPVIAPLIGSARAAVLSDWLDRCFRVERSAFKFVLVARGRR